VNFSVVEFVRVFLIYGHLKFESQEGSVLREHNICHGV